MGNFRRQTSEGNLARLSAPISLNYPHNLTFSHHLTSDIGLIFDAFFLHPSSSTVCSLHLTYVSQLKSCTPVLASSSLLLIFSCFFKTLIKGIRL